MESDNPKVDVLVEARELIAKATPGRWYWNVNPRAKLISLQSEGGMRQFVIDFARWGMNSAQPRFQVDGLMRDAQDCLQIVEGREHHADWYQTINHPDANLIARAPELLSSLCNELEQARHENDRHRTIMEQRVDRETLLKWLNYAEGGPLTMALQPPEFVRHLFAELFVIALDDAPNFQTGSFNWKTQDYEMTIRRIRGKSTAQVLSELKAELETLRSQHATQAESIAQMQAQEKIYRAAIETADRLIVDLYDREIIPSRMGYEVDSVRDVLRASITPKGEQP